MIIATQYAAVKNRKLKEPFGPEDVKRACPGWAPRAYTNFLSKHAVGIPSKTTELFQFQRIGPGQYRTLPSLFDSKLGAGSRLEERRGILKNGFLYCCTRAEGYERRYPRCQNRSAHSCCNDLRYCRIHPIGLVPRSLLLHLCTGSRRRRCLSRSFYLFFYCVGEAEKELEKSVSSARISSISLFAVHHWCSWAVRYI